MQDKVIQHETEKAKAQIQMPRLRKDDVRMRSKTAFMLDMICVPAIIALIIMGVQDLMPYSLVAIWSMLWTAMMTRGDRKKRTVMRGYL